MLIRNAKAAKKLFQLYHNICDPDLLPEINLLSHDSIDAALAAVSENIFRPDTLYFLAKSPAIEHGQVLICVREGMMFPILQTKTDPHLYCAKDFGWLFEQVTQKEKEILLFYLNKR